MDLGTMGPAMDVSIGPCDIIGGGFRVGAALGQNAGMTVGRTLGVYMGPSNGVG